MRTAGRTRIAVLLAAIAFASVAHAGKLPDKAWQRMHSLPFRTGDVSLPGTGATLHVGTGFRYVTRADACALLENWCSGATLGVLIPDEPGLMTRNVWLVEIGYADEGYVADFASNFPGEPQGHEPFYAAVLEQLRQSRQAQNALQPADWPKTLDVQWALSPRFDAKRNVLIWAEDLRLEGHSERMTNFKARVLGRRGYVEMQANADTRNFPGLKDAMMRSSLMVEFGPGLRRQDFRQGDKRSGYDTIGLVIGKPYEDPRWIWVGGVIMGGLALVLLGLAIVLAKVFGTRKAPTGGIS